MRRLFFCIRGRMWCIHHVSCRRKNRNIRRHRQRGEGDIAYIKWLAELQWQKWKNEDEKILRKEGVSEENIRKLREYDWEMFNEERRFQEWQVPMTVYPDGKRVKREEISDVEELLNAIETKELYKVIKGLDSVGQQLLVLKLQGYSTAEIAGKLGITEKAVYRRMDRIKEKIKKIVE